MSAPTDYEQLILELINRARLDPEAEADRIGISLNEGLSAGTITPDTKQPLAYNSTLNNAASDHSNWMLATNTFSHTGSGGSDPGDRMAAAGYQFTGNWTWGENLSWSGTTGTLNLLSAAHNAHDGLFDSAGHRTNILNDDFKEIGIGAETGNFQGYNAFMLTEKFAKSGSGSFITGVAYTDSDGDDFYSIGEGRGNVAVSFAKNGSSIGSTNAWSSGGYSLKTTQTGDIAVTFSGAGLPAAVTATVELGSQNVKVDLIGTDHIEASATTTLGQNAMSLDLLGLNDLDATGNNSANTIEGNAGDNRLFGVKGNDTLTGNDGADRLFGEIGHDTLNGNKGNDYLSGGSGGDTVNGGSGNDTVRGNKGYDTLRGGAGNDKLEGGNGIDTLFGDAGADRLYGQAGNDLLNGNKGDDYLSGGTEDDIVNGGSGNDTVRGNNGDDALRGGDGNDILVGCDGDDELNGGTGADTFVFASVSEGVDDIVDFMTGLDEIELASGGFDNVLNTGNLTSQYFVQGSSATQNHGQLLYNQSTGELAWDADGTGGQAADLFAELANGTSLAYTDFFIV